ncbi:DUF4489 domain-containing protein [Aminipila sp.]|uniref:DUF4489 domain-containing protein n=1 Tax=Aminipila sp. TaxID=2060095 RepID=UPI00289B8758|nr:DUF4489 domain-containing protein [Aminipila sp.]
MNSNSRYNDDCDACAKDRKDYYRPRKEACPTIIKCSCPGAVTIPAATVVNTTFTPASLTINTSKLESPCAKIEFTSNVVGTLFSGTLSFQLFKQCSNQLAPVPVGPAFSYTRAVAITTSDTFTFFVCDCDSCFNDCCTYTVVITVNAVTAGVLSISNATIGAIATCSSCNSGCC